MNEGDNFGTVNGGSGQPDNNIPYNSDPFGQPTTPIMSSPDAAAGQENVSAAPNNNVGVGQGNIPVVSTEGMSNTSKFFGGRARRAFNRNVDTQQQNFLAAQNIASNPNTPQFFSDAVISDNPMPIASPRSKSKKPIIIGGIALVVIAITVGTVFLMLKLGQESEGENIPKVSKEEVKKNYNSYANYLIYGNVSDSDFDLKEYLEQFSSQKPLTLYADKVVEYSKEKSEADNKYIETLKGYYENFVDSYHNSEYADPIGGTLYDYYYNYAIITPPLKSEDILELYAKDNSITTDDIFKKYYSVKTSNEQLLNFLDSQKNLVNAKLKIVKKVQQHGCINGSSINYDCISRLNSEELGEDDVIATNESKAYLTSIALRRQAINELIRTYDTVYEISNIIQGVPQ